MHLKLALERAVRRLQQATVGSPRMNAEVLLMFTLSCDRAYLYAHPERILTEDELARYYRALDERSQGVPAQYITGHQEFWGLDFIVTPAVLIPRPETEHLVESALELAREFWKSPDEFRSRPSRAPRIIDVGTGSGCIALALAKEKELCDARITGSDISTSALEIARVNAARLELESRVRFYHGDLLDGIDPPVGEFDLVVCNPPYVGEGEADAVQREVKKFEPQEAVFAGPYGLEVIRRLIPQARAHLAAGGWLLMEIGYTQESAVRALLSNWAEVRSIADLQGIPRVIAARKDRSA